MNTFWKVALGFIGGVICTCVVLSIIARQLSPEQLIQERREALKQYNIQYFDISTRNGEVTLHTYMPKDSVKMLMGKPSSVDVNNLGVVGVHETWEYAGEDSYMPEFSIKFVNGELESVTQY